MSKSEQPEFSSYLKKISVPLAALLSITGLFTRVKADVIDLGWRLFTIAVLMLCVSWAWYVFTHKSPGVVDSREGVRRYGRKAKILAITAVVASVFAVVVSLGRFHRVLGISSQATDINFGHTGHNPQDARRVHEEDRKALNEANLFLRQFPVKEDGTFLEFRVREEASANYDSLFFWIRENDGIGFMSTYNYLHYLSGCAPNYFDMNEFSVIGYKRTQHGSREFYNSVFCYKAYGNEDLLTVDSVLVALRNGRRRLVVSDNEYSSSSNRVPLRYLQFMGLDSVADSAMWMPKAAIVDMLLEDSHLVAVVSDEDYDARFPRAVQQDLKKSTIPIDIPYDPIVVKTSWWNANDGKRKVLIRAALAIAGNDCWYEEGDRGITEALERYELLMSCPIVKRRNEDGSWMVAINTPKSDLMEYRESLRNGRAVSVRVINWKSLAAGNTDMSLEALRLTGAIGELQWADESTGIARLVVSNGSLIQPGYIVQRTR